MLISFRWPCYTARIHSNTLRVKCLKWGVYSVFTNADFTLFIRMQKKDNRQNHVFTCSESHNNILQVIKEAGFIWF